MSKVSTCLLLALLLTGCAQLHTKNSTDSLIPKDFSTIRGFNYTPALATGYTHADCWINYKEDVIEYDLDLAVRLNLNQCRVFVPYQAYAQVGDDLAGSLQHFVRACYERGIGVMPVVVYPRGRGSNENWEQQSTQWAQFLVDAIGDEPGLAFWDVMNEPDWPTSPQERVDREFAQAEYMAGVFKELDQDTPVTIGCAFVEGAERTAGYVDVLQFHDYLQTRDQIRDSIQKAKALSAKIGKPIFNGEMGCIARANPYDITLQEHMDAGMGWYIWELMIVRAGWGPVHGVFYEDGTVRDPSIAAAILGFFRNRGPDILPADPDREDRVTNTVNDINEWLDQSDAAWDKGLDLAETAAHLMESAELVPMREPPTRQVTLMRQGEQDLPALRELLKKYIEILEPYRKSQ
jgi:hypothetical protein